MTLKVVEQPTREGLRQTILARDLRGIADLIELCFGEGMDRGELSAVREMRAVAALGPLLWLLGAFDRSGLGLGYVWVSDGRVVGNVSTYRGGQGLSGLGPGWLIANVAVNPDQRRRGIARALMEAALDFLERQGAAWVVLQVEHDNEAALALYEGLGFEEVGRLTRWVHSGAVRADQMAPPVATASGRVRSLRADEWETEMNLAARDRVSGLSWTRWLERSQFKQGWPGQIWDILDGRRRVRWVLDDATRILASLWVETTPFGVPRLTLLLEPSANEAEAGLKLVLQGLKGLEGARKVQIEASDRDPALGQGLEALGFRVQLTLVQMRWLPGQGTARQ